MTVAKKSVLNIISGVIGQIVIIAVGLIIPRLLLVSFGSEVNGLYNSSIQIFIYFNLFEAGITAVALQALYAPVANADRSKINGIMSATAKSYRLTGTMYASAVTVLAFIFPFLVDSSLDYWFIVGVILFGGLGNSLNYFFQAKYKIIMQVEGISYITANITTFVNVLMSLAKVVLLLLGFGVIEVQVSVFLINILQVLVFYYFIRKRYGWIDLKVKPDKKAISQKNATFIHLIAQTVFNNTGTLLLTVVTRDLKIVSIYSMYYLVTSNIMTLLTQIPTGVDFRLGQLYNTDKKNYMPLHHIFEIVYLIIGFSVMSVIYIFFLPFMHLYTEGIGDATYINRWYPLFFVLGPMIIFGRNASYNVINFAGHFKKTQWRAVAESVINISVSIVGIYYFGIFGALFGTIVAVLYRANDMIFYVYKYLIDGNPLRTYKRWIGCFLVFFGIVYFVENDMAAVNSYVAILKYGIPYGVGILCLYTVVQVVINPREIRDLIHILKRVLLARQNRE